jgi:dihydroneopterin aldolase
MTLPDLRTQWPALDARSSASPDPAMDVILIEGFRGQTVIGIHGGEDVAQPVRIDVAAGLPRSLACSTDRIADTIDYSAVRDALRDLLARHRYKLLEALAENVAQMLLHDFGAHWARVVVVKPAKFDDVDAVGVAIERRRAADSGSRSEGASASVLSLLGAGLVPGHRAG